MNDAGSNGLPPGPWRLEGKWDDRIVDANGDDVISIGETGGGEPTLILRDEVLRSICALPMMGNPIHSEVERTPDQIRAVARDDAETLEIADRLERDGEVTVESNYRITFRNPRRPQS